MSRRHTYLSKTGWYESFRKRLPIDAQGQPIPWYSYPSIHFLAQRTQASMSVFEFGCGNSTRWWSRRVQRVVSCEHDAGWYNRIATTLPPNAQCHHVPREQYADFVTGFTGQFDVIVIDGVERVACARTCLGALKEDGVIVWDNSDRNEYQPGFDLLTGQGFKRLDFFGLGPIVMIPTMTAVFYREPNCLGI